MLKSANTLNPDAPLLLGQPLLRVPHELLRKTFKTAHKHVERDTTFLTNALNDAIQAVNKGATLGQTVEQLDTMISRIQGLKKKLEALREEEAVLHANARARAEHLNDLYSIENLQDERFEKWSNVQLNRLLVDYMVRQGLGESARALSKAAGIEKLVDIDVFLQCSRIVKSLQARSITECLAWCMDNKQSLKKLNNNLEFELRLQHFIELVRSGDSKGAILYMKKHMAGSTSPDVPKAAALLIYPPDTPFEPYKTLFSPGRWDYLATTFVTTHNNLLSLPSKPPLQIALSAGLSALKTPTCHSSDRRKLLPSGTSLCPICSTELNDLARTVPYAHHTRSSVEADPVVLPNGRIYGLKRLTIIPNKGGKDGRVRDPITGEEFPESHISKVFIT